MNIIKYTVKRRSSSHTLLMGNIDYRAALIFKPGYRFKIKKKTYVVCDIEFNVADVKTNSKTNISIYVSPYTTLKKENYVVK